ncbi:MAG: hypothetical protein AAGF44_02140 [Pseudomonadota bacterium]
MAVLRADTPLYGLWGRFGARRRVLGYRILSTVHGIFSDTLPDDMLPEGCSTGVLFRASQALNYLSGGPRGMTFSARCHRARRTARSWPHRAGWTALAMGIDAACATLRGECEHCATAWTNHITRNRAA